MLGQKKSFYLKEQQQQITEVVIEGVESDCEKPKDVKTLLLQQRKYVKTLLLQQRRDVKTLLLQQRRC